MLDGFGGTRCALALCCLLALGAAPPPVEYPQGYRFWTYIKSGLARVPGHEKFRGMHNIYANQRALKGYRNGTFPDGSVLVFDLLEAKVTAEGIDPGARQLVDVMRRDAKRYAETGGWGYEEFRGNSRTERTVGPSSGKAQCHGCHEKRAAQSYVFTTFSEHDG